MISATADHALRAVLFLARSGSRLITAEEIASAIGAPRNYLSKTLYALSNAGILTSSAGRYGGFSLSRPADQLSIYAVVSVFDQPSPNPRCLLGDRPCTSRNPCAAHAKWTAIEQTRVAALKSMTIAELAAG